MSQQHLLQDQLVQAVPAQLAGCLTCSAEQWLLFRACTSGSGVPDADESCPAVDSDRECGGTLLHAEATRAALSARQGQPLQLAPVSWEAQSVFS